MIESRPGDAFQPGELLNNTYRIEALLGRGGTSDVYKARSEISGRVMALKVLKAELSGNDDFLVLLTREEEMRDIRHDAVVRYSECSRTSSGLVYLMMDYVEGPGLDKRLKEGPMSADDLLIIARRVAEGLNAAHQRKIVHRDLSPDNIILRGGEPSGAVIIDFGIAKDANPGAETIVGNEFAGKYAYAAPEQMNGHSDARTDIYSLGALLLANFRGKPPDVGNNPMEVVQRKGEPLDTDGVPEPLKSLIERMAHPEPDQRLQSAAAILSFLDNPEQSGDDIDIDMDATVITPATRQREAEPETVPPPSSPPPVAEESGKSRTGLFAVLAVVLLAAGGAGGYISGAFDSFLGPQYPPANPFALVVTQAEGKAPVAAGNVPSEDMETKLSELMQARSGEANLTLASGEIADSWANDVMETIDQIDELSTWRLSVSGNRAQVIGTTPDEALQQRLMAAFSEDLPGALEGSADIVFQPIFLAADSLEPVLSELADCGPLELLNVPATGYGPGVPIPVTGRVAHTATRVQVFDALTALAGDRQVIVDVEVLNDTLCLIENHLPNAPDSEIDVSFRVGDSDSDNPSGRFFVGENPVIDVDLPADVTDGYLTVSILDVSGKVFHLLPNLSRDENSVAALRGGQSGPVSIRVAFPLSDLAPGKIAFRVDDSTLGKSKVIVLHSSEPLFDGLRPMEESASGYAEALKQYTLENETAIRSLDSKVLTTAQP